MRFIGSQRTSLTTTNIAFPNVLTPNMNGGNVCGRVSCSRPYVAHSQGNFAELLLLVSLSTCRKNSANAERIFIKFNIGDLY
jgi:hypothetical protein